MPSANRVPMASELLPEPETPATATTHHRGTSTSRSRRLLCRTPRASIAAGSRASRSAAALPGVERNMRVMLCAAPSPIPSRSTEVELSSLAAGWLALGTGQSPRLVVALCTWQMWMRLP